MGCPALRALQAPRVGVVDEERWATLVPSVRQARANLGRQARAEMWVLQDLLVGWGNRVPWDRRVLECLALRVQVG